MIRLILGMLLGSLLLAQGQTPVQPAPGADRYFHLGAQTFVTNDVEPAKEIVNQGLEAHPDDPWLTALKTLLEQQQEQEQQQQQNQQQNENSEQNQEQQDSPPDNQPPQDQSGEPEDEEDTPPQPEPEQPQDANAGEDEEEQPPPPEPGDMSEDEAEMLLDALRQREQAERDMMMRRQIERQSRQAAPVEKDW